MLRKVLRLVALCLAFIVEKEVEASSLRDSVFSLEEFQRQEIREILLAVNDRSVDDLVKDKHWLDKTVERLKFYAPDQFIAFIFSDEQARKSIRSIAGDEPKSILLSVFPLLELKKKDAETLSRSAVELADFLGADVQIIHQYIRQDNTKDLIKYLLNF